MLIRRLDHTALGPTGRAAGAARAGSDPGQAPCWCATSPQAERSALAQVCRGSFEKHWQISAPAGRRLTTGPVLGAGKTP